MIKRVKSFYHDDGDMSQKLSPGNFHSYSCFAEDVIVEEINKNDNTYRIQRWDDANQHHLNCKEMS